MKTENASIKGRRTKNPFGTKGALLYRGKPCMGAPRILRILTRLTAQTIEVWAVLRHSVPNKGLRPLRLRLSLHTCHLKTVLAMERIMAEKFTEKLEDSE